MNDRTAVYGCKRPWIKTLLLLTGLAVSYSCMAFTIGVHNSLTDPETALRWAPNDPRALAASAGQMVWGTKNFDLALAKQRAIAAIKIEPINVEAIAALGALADAEGHPADAKRLFTYAERLSRRHAPTEIWLAENAVADNNVRKTLQHYDRILRVFPALHSTVFPILANAASEDEIAIELSALLKTKPSWARPFLATLSPVKSPENYERLVAAANLDANDPQERPDLVHAMDVLVGVQRPELAYRLYSRAISAPRIPAFLRNGNFEQQVDLPPFGWRMASDGDFAALAMPGNSGQSLFLVARNAQQGDVASQLLLLKQGQYSMRFLTGNSPMPEIDRPKVIIRCINSQDSLGEFRFPSSSTAGVTTNGRFNVPSNCKGQRLTITVRTAPETSDENPWIDDISIRPMASAVQQGGTDDR